MARRRGSARRRRRGGSGFLYKLLSVLLICGCLVAAVTLFFRVDTVVITGEKRYTEAEIREASGVEDGDNLFLLNKYQVIRNIADALPYIEIENTHIQRKLPDTLLIQVRSAATRWPGSRTASFGWSALRERSWSRKPARRGIPPLTAAVCWPPPWGRRSRWTATMRPSARAC